MTTSDRPRPAPAAPRAGCRQALAEAAESLRGTDAPRLTAEALLAHVLGVRRAWLLAHTEYPLSASARAQYAALVRRAARGEPLAYLTGHREFHGLDFLVDARVLVPRPETELLVERALRRLGPRAGRLLDVGTGSGCIAVTLAVRCPAARVAAVDLSAGALAVARQNAARHGVAGRVDLVQADLASAFARPERPGRDGVSLGFDLICANLPYIASGTLAGLAVLEHEPRLALDGGADGLELIRRLLGQAPRLLARGGGLLLEIEASQAERVCALARAAFPGARVQAHLDLAGLDRVVEIEVGP